MKIKLFLLPAAAAAILAGPAAAQIIVHQIPRHRTGYGGGVCAYPPRSPEFNIYESFVHSGRDASPIFIKDPNTGQQISGIGTNYIDGYHDIAYDCKRDRFWVTPWGGPVAWIPVTGGDVRVLGMAIRYQYGIFYERETDRLWVASSYHERIVRVHPDTGQVEETIEVNHGFDSSRFDGPTGLVKIGENFWIGVAGDYPQQAGLGYLVELDRRGNRTARPPFLMPPSKYSHDIGGFSLDAAGFLWVKGGKDTAIYRIDIGHQPITPIPSPTPTPEATPTPVATPTPIHYPPILDSGDYNGDGISDLAIFRPSGGLWAIRGVSRFYFGQAGDVPVSGDYTGDGTTDPAVYRPARGLWAIRGVTQVIFGGSQDIPVPGDYYGDGTCDIGIFRPASGLWAIRGVTRAYFGSPGDRPVPGYYAGLGGKDLAVFRPATGLWSIRGMTQVYFGRRGDLPVPGDYSGAGREEIAIYRPGNRLWAVRGLTRFTYGLSSGDRPRPADFQRQGLSGVAVFNPANGFWGVRGSTRVYFGRPGDVPVSAPPPRPGDWRLPIIDSGDYLGQGHSQIAIFRGSTGRWSIIGPYHTFHPHYGSKGDIPVSGDYDGSGTSDIAVYRPSSGLWSARFVTQFYFGGEPGDLPAPGDYTGNGICDAAIFNPGEALWQIRVEIPFSSRDAFQAALGDEVELIASGKEEPEPAKGPSSTIPFFARFTFGEEGDIPVPGYYRGRPRKTVATYGPSTGLWSIRGISQFYFGAEGDFPVTGDFTGDGTDEVGIFRPSSRLWAIRGVTRIYYGRSDDDLPVPADYRGDGTAEFGTFRPRTGLWEIRGLTRIFFGRTGDTPAVGAPGR